MPVAMPTAGMEIHLDVSQAWLFSGPLNDRLAKIRPALVVPKARVQHLEGVPIQTNELVA